MFTVNLDVRNFAATDPNWTSVQASNGQTYSYRYADTGGGDGRGDFDFRLHAGQQQIQVNLVADVRYQIQSISFAGSASADFSVQGAAPRTRVILDSDEDEGTVDYSVLINDTVAGCTIPCDPQIRNQP